MATMRVSSHPRRLLARREAPTRASQPGTREARTLAAHSRAIVPPALRPAGTAMASPANPRSAPRSGEPTRKARALGTMGARVAAGAATRAMDRMVPTPGMATVTAARIIARMMRSWRAARPGGRRIEAVGEQVASADTHNHDGRSEDSPRPRDVRGGHRHDRSGEEGADGQGKGLEPGGQEVAGSKTRG